MACPCAHLCVCVCVRVCVCVCAQWCTALQNGNTHARAGGATDEEIRAAGERAALEFRQESELIKRSKNMQGDAQTRCALFCVTVRVSECVYV